jgi:hypothetical protein
MKRNRREYDSFGLALRWWAVVFYGISLGATIERYRPNAGFLLGTLTLAAAIALTFLAFSRAKPLSDGKLKIGV